MQCRTTTLDPEVTLPKVTATSRRLLKPLASEKLWLSKWEVRGLEAHVPLQQTLCLLKLSEVPVLGSKCHWKLLVEGPEVAKLGPVRTPRGPHSNLKSTMNRQPMHTPAN